MAKSEVNARRFDPYKNFKFRLKCGGRYVAGVSKVSALKRSPNVVEHRAGGDASLPRTPIRPTKPESVTLEQGVTHDSEFVTWATSGSGAGTEMRTKNLRKDVLIELYDETGQLTQSYKLHRCWVSEFRATPDLNAKSDALAIETMTLENEGWESEFDANADAGRRNQ